MTTIDVNNLLSQMRQMAAQVRPPAAMPMPEVALTGAGQAGGLPDFSSVLKHSIAAVGNSQMEAGKLAASFERGDKGADLGRTMIAVQKADLSLRTMVEVRNKMVDAYKDIMNMPV